MASLGVLQSMLGFGEEEQALMIALYIAMDSFGTACNVTGDGAIALVVDKLARRKSGEWYVLQFQYRAKRERLLAVNVKPIAPDGRL